MRGGLPFGVRRSPRPTGAAFMNEGMPLGYVLVALRALQVVKGAWWMPWLSEAMKDVTSCDNPRRGASGR